MRTLLCKPLKIQKSSLQQKWDSLNCLKTRLKMKTCFKCIEMSNDLKFCLMTKWTDCLGD